MLSLILNLVDAMEANDAYQVFELVKQLKEQLGHEAAVKLSQGILEELKARGVVQPLPLVLASTA